MAEIDWLPIIIVLIIGIAIGAAITYATRGLKKENPAKKDPELERLDAEARDLERGFRE